eukprot:4994082-Prymnesium_polylepis.1
MPLCCAPSTAGSAPGGGRSSAPSRFGFISPASRGLSTKRSVQASCLVRMSRKTAIFCPSTICAPVTTCCEACSSVPRRHRRGQEPTCSCIPSIGQRTTRNSQNHTMCAQQASEHIHICMPTQCTQPLENNCLLWCVCNTQVIDDTYGYPIGVWGGKVRQFVCRG